MAKQDNYYSSGTQGLAWYEQLGVGAASGVLKIGEGIAELGAGFIDYAADTDLLEYIEENYPKINVDDGLGKMTELIVQYGLPYSAALKIAGKVTSIKKLGDVSKAGGIKGTAAKLGYYGLPAMVSEPLVSTSRDATLGQAFGLYSDDFMQDLDPTQYEGRDRAAASLQQKLLFGLEAGPFVGGVTTFLGPAIKKSAQAIGYVGGPVVKATGNYVLNPLAKVAASERTGLPQSIKAIGQGRVKAGEFLGIPKYENWRLFHTGSTATKERVFKRIDNVLATLRTSGRADVEVQPIMTKAFNELEATKFGAEKNLENIDRLANELVKKTGETNKGMTTAAKNEMFEGIVQYLTSKKSITTAAGKSYKSPTRYLDSLGSSELKDAVKTLKVEFDAFKNTVKNVLEPDEVDKLFRGDLNKYLNRSFEITRNSSFKVSTKDKEGVTALFSKMLRGMKDFKTADDILVKETAEAQVDDLIELAVHEGKNAENLVKVSSEFISKEFGTVKSFLKKGEDLPGVVRKMFGESIDKRAQILDTISDMATIKGKRLMLDELTQVLGSKGVLITADNSVSAARLFRTSTGVRRPLVEITGKDINSILGKNIIGKYTTPEIAAALKGQTLATDILLQSSIYKAFIATKGMSQLSKTVLSPTTQIRNVESAAMFALANGHFGRGASLHDAMRFVFKDVVGPKGKVDVEMLQKLGSEYRRMGVTNSSIITRETSALIDDILTSSLDKGGKLGRTENLLKTMQDSSILKNATKVYQGGDDLWKIFGYEFEKSKLLNIIRASKPGTNSHIDDADKYFREVFGRRFNKYMPDGTSLKTREEAIKEIAAETIKNTYPNYSYVGTLVQNLRRLPLGNFISFPAEMYRTSFNLIKFGLREMQSSDALVRQSGAKKLIGFSSAIAAGTVAQEVAMNTVGVSEEQLNAIRESFVASWNKSGPLVPVAKEIEGDKVIYKFVNFAYQSPYDVITAPYYAAMGQINKGRLEEKDLDDVMFKAFFGDQTGPGAFTALLSPFLSEAIITEKINDLVIRGGRTNNGRIILSDEDSASDKVVKGVFHLLDGLTPGVFNQVTNMARGVAREQGAYKEMNASDEALALIAGIRINEANVGKSLGFKVNSFVRSQREAKRLLTSEIAKANVNPETIYRQYEKLLQNRFENYSEIRKVFSDAEKLGYKKVYINRQIDRRIQKSDRAIIFSGRFMPDDWSKLITDQRLVNNLKEQNIKLRDFIDYDVLRALYNKYRNKTFAERF